MPIKTIVVPTDFSENSQIAFERACDLARQLGAKVYLLHIQDGSSLRTAIKEELFQTNTTDRQLQQSVKDLIAQRFSEMTAGLDRLDLFVECLSRRGYPKTAIVRFAKEIKSDLVVIGMRGITAMSTLTSAAFGSVAEWVLRRSPCPTVVVRLEHSAKRGQ